MPIMDFQEKVKFLRTLPAFKVVPISEVKAIAFVAKDAGENGDFLLGKGSSRALYLNRIDIEKIVRVYPDLEAKLKS
jgi:hypothetical protein